MHLDTFHLMIPSKIIEQGLAVYHKQLFSGFSHDDQEYSLFVHDALEKVPVSVRMDQAKNITTATCACTIKEAPVCYHVVALLYVIINQVFEKEKHHTPVPKAIQLDNRLEAIVSRLDRKTLERLFLAEIHKNPPLHKQVMAIDYRTEDEKIAEAYDTTRAVLMQIETSHQVYFDADDTSPLVRIRRIFGESYRAENPEFAIRTILAVIVASLTTETPKTDIATKTLQAAFEALEKLFRFHEHDEARQAVYYDVLFRFSEQAEENMLHRCLEPYYLAMARVCPEEEREGFQAMLETFMEYDDFEAHHKASLQVVQFFHLCRYADEHTVKATYQASLDNERLHEMAYTWAMEHAVHAMAIEAAERIYQAAEDTHTKHHAGNLLLEALLEQGKTDDVKTVLRSRVLQGSVAALDLYLQSLEGHEHALETETLLEALMNQPGMATVFQKLALHLKQVAALMTYVEAYPSWVIEAYTHLSQPAFQDRLYRVFESVILDQAAHAKQREDYVSIAQMYQHAHRALGHRAYPIEQKLLTLYPRKTSLRQALEQARHSLQSKESYKHKPYD